MKIEKIAALAEIVSSVAILGTLAYLAIQTQQNTNALRTTSQQSVLQSGLDWLNTVVAYPEVILSDREDLPPADQVRLRAFGIKLLRTRELNWIQYQNGILDEPTFQSFLEPMGTFFSRDAEAMEQLRNYGGNQEYKVYILGWLEEQR